MKQKKTRARTRNSDSGATARRVLAAFFLGGVAALMHEVVWAKLLVRLIGATAYAQAAVRAVFMGGLALGSAIFGRRSDRSGRPLWTYAVLELSVGAYCLLLPLLLYLAGPARLGKAEKRSTGRPVSSVGPLQFSVAGSR